jgi:hypothetical protein
VYNGTTGGKSLRFIGSSDSGVTVANGKRAIVYCDGATWNRVTAGVIFQIFPAAVKFPWSAGAWSTRQD